MSHQKITKKRKISSGEVAAEDLPLIENAFNSIIATIDAISTGKLADVEDLHDIRNGVIQALDTVTNIKKWIAENPKSDVKAISFSKFDHDLLKDRLGVVVKEINPSLTLDQFGEQLTKELLRTKDSRLLDEIKEVIEGRDFQPLRRLLLLIEGGVHIHPEASGRMLIDQWLLESMDISSNMKGSRDMAPEGYRSFLFPEFQLSSLTDNPSRIIFKTSITYITGSTDYALWSVPSQEFSRMHERVLMTKKFNYALITPAGTFTIFEAKRSTEDLNYHIPQAVAQCLAMAENGNYDEQNLSEMGFCLTTGKSWLFGIVDCAASLPKVCWKTNIFQVDAAPDLETIKSLVKLIVLWVQYFHLLSKSRY